MKDGAKKVIYRELLRELDAVLEGIDDPITAMSTCAAVLHQRLPYASWTGFYRVVAPRLLRVGPYQGPSGMPRNPLRSRRLRRRRARRRDTARRRRSRLPGPYRLRRGGTLRNRHSRPRFTRRSRRRSRPRFAPAGSLRRARSRGIGKGRGTIERVPRRLRRGVFQELALVLELAAVLSMTPVMFNVTAVILKMTSGHPLPDHFHLEDGSGHVGRRAGCRRARSCRMRYDSAWARDPARRAASARLPHSAMARATNVRRNGIDLLVIRRLGRAAGGQLQVLGLDVAPPARVTATARTFSSSRTLPGQRWASSRARASRESRRPAGALRAGEEVLGELRDVLAALAQRRQLDAAHARR